jgi:two-component system, OmpR family, response regulator ChvI
MKERKRILVVDDEPDITLSLKLCLDENGVKVDSFNDALLALRNFKTGLYDILILDVKMPKMNGFKLYKEMKKIDNSVEVFFLTALSEFQNYEEFNEIPLKLRQSHFIQKPIENQELLTRINMIMGSP